MPSEELIRFTFGIKRKQGVSEEEFHKHWAERHGPLVSQVLLRTKVIRYVQVTRSSLPGIFYGRSDCQ
jgi:EthD domain